MSLEDLEISLGALAADRETEPFIADAGARAAGIRSRDPNDATRIGAFVDSNLLVARAALQQIIRQNLAPGLRFCEWGSGAGGVTCVAAMLGFSACGIEIVPELVAVARRLADDYGIPARFHLGSYKPPADPLDTIDRKAWVAMTGADWAAYDVIYAYPWPAEQRFIDTNFERFAPPGALLVTYHGGLDIQVRRQPANPRG